MNDPLSVMLWEKEREIDALHGRIIELGHELALRDPGNPALDADGRRMVDMFRVLMMICDRVDWHLRGLADYGEELNALIFRVRDLMPVARLGDHALGGSETGVEPVKWLRAVRSIPESAEGQ